MQANRVGILMKVDSVALLPRGPISEWQFYLHGVHRKNCLVDSRGEFAESH